MESIWMDTGLQQFPALTGNRKTDILIIGGGMAGLLCAHLLTAAGKQCIVAEAATVAGGTTQNTTAKITSQHGLIYTQLAERFDRNTAGLYLEANENALAQLRQLCQNISCDFQEAHSHIYSRNDPDVLEEELEILRDLGFGAELTKKLPLPFPTAGAVTFPRQAQFHPLKFLRAVVSGLTVFEHTPVRRLEGSTAITDNGSITADAVIVATHFPFLNKHGSYFMKLYQQRSYVLALENAPKIEGMYLDAAPNGLSFRSWGKILLLGGGGHRTGKHGGSWQELEDFVRRHYPAAKILRRWAAQDCMSLDGMPYIGQYAPGTPNLFVATGFNKWGMTSSMVAAQLLTDRILGRPNPYTELFSPSRSMLHPQLGINLAESTANLLTPTAPRCPHMGCALKWNPRERSWDCPCHGSRFEENGKRLDGPAAADLKKKH